MVLFYTQQADFVKRFWKKIKKKLSLTFLGNLSVFARQIERICQGGYFF